MDNILRYFRLWFALAKFSLMGELAFRANFLVKVFVEFLWLSVLVLFNYTLFAQTSHIAEWNQFEYLFFVGCYYMLGGLLECTFVENCNMFSEWVRTGELDFFLLKPVDEQFLVSCKRFDWSTAPNVLMGAGVMIFALIEMEWTFAWWPVLQFVMLLAMGAAMLYGFLIILTSLSIWFMRNQSLFEMWWLFTTIMRYPREIFRGTWATPVGLFFTFAVPILLVTNVPARVILNKIQSPWMILYMLLATIVVLAVSRWFFKLAMRRYRSASS